MRLPPGGWPGRAGDDMRRSNSGEEQRSALRDARSAGSGLFCQFGLMTDDYAAKPAFGLYREMIDKLSA